MAITNRVDLSGSVYSTEGCTKLTFSDTTGFKVTTCECDQNDDGYGLTGGIALDDVTGAVLNVYLPDLSTPYIFTFVIASHVITSCIVTDLNLDDTDITAFLESTVFPLTDFYINNPDYTGVTFPALTDGNVNWDYTISGTSGGTAFSYTTSDIQLLDCSANCCIENSYLELDSSCSCCDSKIESIIKSEIFLNAARYAASTGDATKASEYILKAKEICSSNCSSC